MGGTQEMASRSLSPALVLAAATMVLSGGMCSSGGGDSGPAGTTLAAALDAAPVGEMFDFTQHTGTMTVSTADRATFVAILEFLFLDGPPPIISADATIAATADGSDLNLAHIKVTDALDHDFIFNTASIGDLEMGIISAESDPVILAESIGAPAVGDPIAFMILSAPVEDHPVFGVLNYMSVASWITALEPTADATEVTVEFGVGHWGLVTPVADIPSTGTAGYSGIFHGIYVDPGVGADGIAVVATGDAAFTADFAAGTVDGGITAIGLVGVDLAGATFIDPKGGASAIDFDSVTISGNTFSGGVVPGGGGFADFGVASTGTLDGTFYGPIAPSNFDDGPAEAGVVLTLDDATSDAFVTGVIGARID